MGMTIAEKILAKKGGLKKVGPGDLVTVAVDTVILFDNNFMTNRWREVLKVNNPDSIIVVFDHRKRATQHGLHHIRLVQGLSRCA
jgi:3-isopropylmalate/(R)-2-methylmalate dehydratase large subunit